jgi:hypothetical protein
MGDPIQPRGKRDSSVGVILNVVHCPLEYAGGEVLRIVEITGSVIHVIEDAIHILFIQLTERVPVAQRRAGKDFIFVDVEIRQGDFLPAELNQITPPGFRSCREYNMQRFKSIERRMMLRGYNEILRACPYSAGYEHFVIVARVKSD